MSRKTQSDYGRGNVLIIGVALIVIGLLVPKLAVLFTIGIILAIIGVVLIIAEGYGHPVGGRRWY